jgi:hypothetical protein
MTTINLEKPSKQLHHQTLTIALIGVIVTFAVAGAPEAYAAGGAQQQNSNSQPQNSYADWLIVPGLASANNLKR